MSWFKRSLLTSWLLVCFIHPAFANDMSADDTTGSDDTRSYHLADDMDMNSSVHFQYAKPRIVIKAIYPELQSENKADAVLMINQLVLDLVKEESANFQKRVDENRSGQAHLPKNKIKNNFYIDYSSSSGTVGKHFVISLRFSLQGYIAGMAHPYHYHRVINYDLTSQQQLELPDLFRPDSDYLKMLSDYSRQSLTKRLDNNDMIYKGTEPNVDNFKMWNFGPNGLLFTFEEYQVAPYVNGAQTIMIPYSELKPFIPDDSPLASCLKKQTRCMRNNIETGGFIDEM